MDNLAWPSGQTGLPPLDAIVCQAGHFPDGCGAKMTAFPFDKTDGILKNQMDCSFLIFAD